MKSKSTVVTGAPWMAAAALPIRMASSRTSASAATTELSNRLRVYAVASQGYHAPAVQQAHGQPCYLPGTTSPYTNPLNLESDSLFNNLVGRMEFTEAVETWSRCRQNLTRWEDQHLLVDKPSPEMLERHRNRLERLMFFGQLFAFVASHPEFNDIETAEMIQANQFILREKYQMFHQPNPMSGKQADLLLREVFPES